MVAVRPHIIPERTSLSMLAGCCRAPTVRDHPSASSHELGKERAHVPAADMVSRELAALGS
jgi:hypothetical protein